MGHQRLGKLPAYRLLPEIIRYLVDGGTPTEEIVDQITAFGQEALKFALKDDVFIEALWLLIRLPQAAASKDPVAALAELGIKGSPFPSITEILFQYDQIVERAQRRMHQGTTDLLRLKFQVQHPAPAGHRMLRWTNDTSTSTARNVA